MSNVKEIIDEIKKNLSQESSSSKDEEKVMQAILNDKEYVVGVYGNSGKVGEYCPSEDARKLSASIIQSTTKISSAEAEKLAEDHTFTKNEAKCMIGISKEFINTYVQTGRKLPLGGRETSNVKLIIKHEEEKTKRYPKKVGVNEDGSARYDQDATTTIPAHDTIRVQGSCPTWLKR